MGMCKGCSEVFPANEMKNGLCEKCIQSGVINEEKPTSDSNQNMMSFYGIGMIVVDLLWGAYAFTMDTTVTSDAKTLESGEYSVYIPSVTVNNLGLMNQQRNQMFGAGVCFIGGLILFGFGANREKK